MFERVLEGVLEKVLEGMRDGVLEEVRDGYWKRVLEGVLQGLPERVWETILEGLLERVMEGVPQVALEGPSLSREGPSLPLGNDRLRPNRFREGGVSWCSPGGNVRPSVRLKGGGPKISRICPFFLRWNFGGVFDARPVEWGPEQGVTQTTTTTTP